MLAPGLGLTPEDIKDRVDRSKNEPKFRPIILKEDVDVRDIAFINARKLELRDEVFVEYQPRRSISKASWRLTPSVISVRSLLMN